jgi:hypothetical protein
VATFTFGKSRYLTRDETHELGSRIEEETSIPQHTGKKLKQTNKSSTMSKRINLYKYVSYIPTLTPSPEGLISFIRATEELYNQLKKYFTRDNTLEKSFINLLAGKLPTNLEVIITDTDVTSYEQFKKKVREHCKADNYSRALAYDIMSIRPLKDEPLDDLRSRMEGLFATYKIAKKTEGASDAEIQSDIESFGNTLVTTIPLLLDQPFAQFAMTEKFANFSEFKDFLTKHAEVTNTQKLMNVKAQVLLVAGQDEEYDISRSKLMKTNENLTSTIEQLLAIIATLTLRQIDSTRSTGQQDQKDYRSRSSSRDRYNDDTNNKYYNNYHSDSDDDQRDERYESYDQYRPRDGNRHWNYNQNQGNWREYDGERSPSYTDVQNNYEDYRCDAE